MRRDLVKVILVILMLNLFLASTSFAPTPTVVSVDPANIPDKQTRPEAPIVKSYPGIHNSTALVTNPTYAYDKIITTYATVSPQAGTSTSWYYFNLKTFNSTLSKEYISLDINMNYSVTAWRGQYRFVLWVGSKNQTLGAASNLNVTTPVVTTWQAVFEPNDGLWSQTDINNLVLRVDVKRTSSTGWCTFKEYEAWVSIPMDSFAVRLNISDVTQMVLWQVNLTFNPSVLEVVAAREGPFLKSVQAPPPQPPGIPGTNFAVTYGPNSVQAVCVLKSYNYGGANGSGVLATFHFRAIAEGNSVLNISAPETYLLTWQGGQLLDIPCDKNNGFFIYPIGDANSDLTVNVFDILAVKSRWGRTPASPDWMFEYDVNYDDAINVFDILTIKAHWGETAP